MALYKASLAVQIKVSFSSVLLPSSAKLSLGFKKRFAINSILGLYSSKSNPNILLPNAIPARFLV